MIAVWPDSGRSLLPSFPSVFLGFHLSGISVQSVVRSLLHFPRNEPPNSAKYFSERPEM